MKGMILQCCIMATCVAVIMAMLWLSERNTRLSYETTIEQIRTGIFRSEDIYLSVDSPNYTFSGEDNETIFSYGLYGVNEGEVTPITLSVPLNSLSLAFSSFSDEYTYVFGYLVVKISI